MKEKIRPSTYLLGIQLFSSYINPTGWDSIGFSFPIWILYIAMRIIEKSKGDKKIVISRRVWRDIFPLIVWIILVVFNMIYFFRNEGAVRIGFYYIVGASFFMTIADAQLNSKELHYIISVYVFWGLIGAVLLLIQRVPVFGYNNRYTIQIIGQGKDPNFYSAYLMFPCLVCWKQLFSEKRAWKNVLCGCIFILAIFLTGSRSSFLALCVGIGIIIFSNIKLNKNFIKAILIGVVLLLMFIWFLPENIKSRLILLQSYNDGSNRLRFNAWKAAVNVWKEHPFLGAGLNAGESYGTQFGGWIQMMTHNSYLDVLCEMGVLGLILFMIVPIKLLKRSFFRKEFLVLAGLISQLFVSLIISAQYSQFFWFNLSLFYLMLKNNDKIDQSFYARLQSGCVS